MFCNGKSISLGHAWIRGVMHLGVMKMSLCGSRRKDVEIKGEKGGTGNYYHWG